MKDKIIFTFPILYSGWECHAVGYVMENIDKSRYIYVPLSSEPIVDNPVIETVEDLKKCITIYKEVIAETQKAIDLVTGEKK